MNIKHGACANGSPPEYVAWVGMLHRCNNPKHKAFKNYGARGIGVCLRWMTYENFLQDMGKRPTGMTLERKNNDLGYFPENCKWVTPREQALNRRNTVNLTAFAVTLCQADWARKVGCHPSAIAFHIRNERTVEWIITHLGGMKFIGG